MQNGNNLTVRLDRDGSDPCECSIPVHAIPWELFINLALQALMAWLATQTKPATETPSSS